MEVTHVPSTAAMSLLRDPPPSETSLSDQVGNSVFITGWNVTITDVSLRKKQKKNLKRFCVDNLWLSRLLQLCRASPLTFLSHGARTAPKRGSY